MALARGGDGTGPRRGWHWPAAGWHWPAVALARGWGCTGWHWPAACSPPAGHRRRPARRPPRRPEQARDPVAARARSPLVRRRRGAVGGRENARQLRRRAGARGFVPGRASARCAACGMSAASIKREPKVTAGTGVREHGGNGAFTSTLAALTSRGGWPAHVLVPSSLERPTLRIPPLLSRSCTHPVRFCLDGRWFS